MVLIAVWWGFFHSLVAWEFLYRALSVLGLLPPMECSQAALKDVI